MKMSYPAVLVALLLAGCIEDAPPQSFTQLEAAAPLTVQEREACDAGKYDAKSWKADYCGTVQRAIAIHRAAGRVYLNGKLAEGAYTIDQLKGDASLAAQERKACASGAYDAKSWKRSYCFSVDTAYAHHVGAGRLQLTEAAK